MYQVVSLSNAYLYIRIQGYYKSTRFHSASWCNFLFTSVQMLVWVHKVQQWKQILQALAYFRVHMAKNCLYLYKWTKSNKKQKIYFRKTLFIYCMSLNTVES